MFPTVKRGQFCTDLILGTIFTLHFHNNVRFQFVNLNMIMKSNILWVVMPYSSEIAQRFRGTLRPHLQSQRICQASNQQKQMISLNYRQMAIHILLSYTEQVQDWKSMYLGLT
jgi:hypothetical protein